MDSDTWILFIALVLLVLLGGFFASSEIAFASVNKFRVKIEAERGNVKAIRALYIIENFEDTLTTLLVGNNIAHIFAASIATLITTKLWGQWAIIYSTIAMTLIVFLISETIPKVLAKSKSYSYSLALSNTLYALMKLMSPVNFLLTKISKFLIQVLIPKSSINISKQDLHRIVESMPRNEKQDKNKELFRFALNFGETTAAQILTDKSQIVGLSINDEQSKAVEKIKQSTHSRLPVFDGDKIVGVLQIRKYLKSYARNPKLTAVNQLMDKPLFVKCDEAIDEVFKKMSVAKVNMAIVTDKDSAICGILTIEDILEQLVGDIWDEDDAEKSEAVNGGATC